MWEFTAPIDFRMLDEPEKVRRSGRGRSRNPLAIRDCKKKRRATDVPIVR